jgi:hypothetical protein
MHKKWTDFNKVRLRKQLLQSHGVHSFSAFYIWA